MMASLACRAPGLRGVLKAVSGEMLEAEVDVPMAPGTPFTLEVEVGVSGLSLGCKCVGTRKLAAAADSARFLLRARMLAVSQRDLERLDRALRGGPTAGD